MDPVRKSALVVGVLFIVTFAASIPPAFIFYTPVLNDSHYVLGAGKALVAIHKWTFLLGPGFCPVIGIWLTVKGFRASAVADDLSRSVVEQGAERA